MCYKIVHGHVYTDIARAIGYSPYNSTRGNPLKLAKRAVRFLVSSEMSDVSTFLIFSCLSLNPEGLP
jgi:hypothetical protein